MASPDPATALADDARALLAAGDPASAHAQAVVAACLAPFDPALDDLVGECLAAGRLVEAADALSRAVARDPDRVATWTKLGVVAERLGDLETAAAAFARAAPDDAHALRELGSVQVRRRRLDEAAALYRRVRALVPDDPTATHMLAALGGEAPAAPPPGHVRALFDSYAADFEDSLVGALGYRVPALLRAVLPGAKRFGRALDLGCGTGLAGAAVRDVVGYLEGVDASPRMVERARDYDALFVGDLVEHLQQDGDPFDLVLAADVLLYLGDLAPVHAAVHRRLADGGWFVYSVEAGPPGHDYRLAPTGRYEHGRAYLESLAVAHGFTIVRLDTAALRREAGEPVEGWIAVLARSAVG